MEVSEMNELAQGARALCSDKAYEFDCLYEDSGMPIYNKSADVYRLLLTALTERDRYRGALEKIVDNEWDQSPGRETGSERIAREALEP